MLRRNRLFGAKDGANAGDDLGAAVACWIGLLPIEVDGMGLKNSD